jgi:hypothetical protein
MVDSVVHEASTKQDGMLLAKNLVVACPDSPHSLDIECCGPLICSKILFKNMARQWDVVRLTLDSFSKSTQVDVEDEVGPFLTAGQILTRFGACAVPKDR